MRTRLLTVATGILVALVWGCAQVACLAADQTPPSVAPAVTSAAPPAYRLLPEDSMRIVVRNEPDFSADQMVDPAGNISLPELGVIHAEGLTQQELQEKIAAGLTKWIRNPQVQISIMSFRKPKVTVSGYVNRPGLQEIKQGDRVMDAIAQAGSFSETALLRGATLTHKGSPTSTPLDLDALFYKNDMSQNLELQDGDTIFVPEDKGRYYVLGEVTRPGMFRLKEDVSVIEAISTAGGATQRGSLKSTFIIRGDPKNPQRIKVDIDKLTSKGDLTQNVALQAGDVVYVSETSKPDWGKIGGILSAAVNSTYLFGRWLGF